MEIKEISGRAELNKAFGTGVPVIADFYASWCAPCKMQSPVLREFSERAGDKAQIIKIDVDVNADIASEYGVESVPTVILFSEGIERERRVGLTSAAELSAMLIGYI